MRSITDAQRKQRRLREPVGLKNGLDDCRGIARRQDPEGTQWDLQKDKDCSSGGICLGGSRSTVSGKKKTLVA